LKTNVLSVIKESYLRLSIKLYLYKNMLFSDYIETTYSMYKSTMGRTCTQYRNDTKGTSQH